MADPRIYKSVDNVWVPRNLSNTLSLVTDNALQAEVVSRNLERKVEVATYQGIDPSAYPVDTLLNVVDINTVFRVVDDVTVGKWLCPERYYQSVNGTFADITRLTGAVEEDAEANPWILFNNGTSGTSTSDGTHLTITAPVTSGQAQVYIDLAGTGGICWHGLITWTTLTGVTAAGLAFIRLIDGTDDVFAAVCNNRYEFMGAQTDTVATAGTFALQSLPVALSVEHHLMMIQIDGVTECYQDGVLVFSGETTSGGASALRRITIGNANVSPAVVVKVREGYGAAA